MPGFARQKGFLLNPFRFAGGGGGGGTISEVDSGTDNSREFLDQSTGNLTKSTGTASGDIGIILVSWWERSSYTITTPTGWTAPSGNQLAIGGAGGARNLLTVFYRVMDGSEGANWAVSFSGSTYGNAVLLTLRNSAGAMSFVSATAGTAATGTTLTAPDVSGTDGYGLVVACGTSDPATHTTPGGMTIGPVGGSGTNTGRFFWEQLAATGATGTRVSTLGTSRDNGAFSILVAGP